MAGAGIYIKQAGVLVAAATVPGKQGSQGPGVTLTPGTITTGAAGTSVIATITGTTPAQTLNLTIPKGDPGGWVNSALVAAGTNLDTITAAGLYFPTGDASLNTIALNYPTNGYGGYLEVIYAAGSTILQRLTPASPLIGASTAINRGTWIRTRYGTWGPWQRMAAVGEPGGSDLTGTGSPEGVVTAPVGTYYTDTALTNGAMRWAKKTGTGNTGWKVVDGDTGWRRFTSLANGWTGGLDVRRVNDTVHLRTYYTGGLVGTAATASSCINPSGTIGPGFGPPLGAGEYRILMYRPSGASIQSSYLYWNGGSGQFNMPGFGAGTDAYSLFTGTSWCTPDAWPATLPGVGV